MKILITGTSSGIGKATTEYLRERGHDVREIKGRSDCDVSDKTAVLEFKNKLTRENWLPDVIILNAGIFPDDITPAFNREAFDKTFAVNLGGAINCIEAFLPKMLMRGKLAPRSLGEVGGHFIGISSSAAFRPNIRSIAYPASKAALGLVLRGFDLHYRTRGVAFSTVYLGPTATEMWEGKKSLLVATPKRVAQTIERLIYTKKSVIFYPFLSSLLVRMLMLFPDRIYWAIRKYLVK